jgi:ATP-dependent exoDNAse (exonuclease V) beta subunit
MTELRLRTMDITDLENIKLNTIQEDGKRFYVDDNGERYPSVTTVTSLLTRDHIKLWRERVGEEEANKVSSQAAKRGTKFHQNIEDYLRQEKDIIEFDNILQEGMFKAVQPVLDEIVPLALEAPLWSPNLKMAGRVDCVGMLDGNLCIIDFKSSGKYKEEYMTKPWFIQMTAYALMVEELTGQQVDELVALVGVEGQNAFQIFYGNPLDYIDELVDLRKRYTNVYGV